MGRAEEVTKEDLVTFINAAFTCTGQREFYGESQAQSLSIQFLHEYIRGNYRRLYARTLATGINHFNQAEIIKGLLSTGAATPKDFAKEENALITKALRALPPQRTYKLLQALRDQRTNNRRTRAMIRDFISGRRDPIFDAVKYRSKVRALVVHAHLKLQDERSGFLFAGWRQRKYETPMFEDFRAAHHSEQAIYRLPFTVAEGLARKMKVPRERFLENIQDKMTSGEKMRMSERVDFDLLQAPLTKLASYIVSLPVAERRERFAELDRVLQGAADRAYRRGPFSYGQTAMIFDRSYSTSGSSEKRRRPLAVALATWALLFRADPQLSVHYTTPAEHPMFATPSGQTAIAAPLLEALERKPELIVIVSDGYENDPPNLAAHIAGAYLRKVRKTLIVHANPVFNDEDYAPKAFGAPIPTLGLRDAEDLPTLLGFARVASGLAELDELEKYLQGRVGDYLA